MAHVNELTGLGDRHGRVVARRELLSLMLVLENSPVLCAYGLARCAWLSASAVGAAQRLPLTHDLSPNLVGDKPGTTSLAAPSPCSSSCRCPPRICMAWFFCLNGWLPDRWPQDAW